MTADISRIAEGKNQAFKTRAHFFRKYFFRVLVKLKVEDL